MREGEARGGSLADGWEGRKLSLRDGPGNQRSLQLSHAAQTGNKAGQRWWRPPGCSQECCSSTSTEAQHPQQFPAQKMGWSLLFLCSQLHKNSSLRVSPPFSCCFEPSARQLLVFLSRKSPFLDTWKLGRVGKKPSNKRRCEGEGKCWGWAEFYF